MNKGKPLRVDRCRQEEIFYYPDGTVKVIRHIPPNYSPCVTCGKLIENDGIHTDGLVCDSCKPEEVPLLVIEVKDLNSIPIVMLRGEEITGRIAVEYKWETKTDVNTTHEYVIEQAIKREDNVPIVRKVSEKFFR